MTIFFFLSNYLFSQCSPLTRHPFALPSFHVAPYVQLSLLIFLPLPSMQSCLPSFFFLLILISFLLYSFYSSIPHYIISLIYSPPLNSFSSPLITQFLSPHLSSTHISIPSPCYFILCHAAFHLYLPSI